MTSNRNKGIDPVKRAFRIALACHLVMMAIGFVIGYSLNNSKLALAGFANAREKFTLLLACSGSVAARVIQHNIEVGLTMSLISLLPLYGMVLSSGQLGFLLGQLLKAVFSSPGLPTAGGLAMILPHGGLEYLGFALMFSSGTALHIAAANRLLGREFEWRRLARFCLLRFVVGVVLLAVAALVEGFVTPLISQRYFKG